MKIKLSLFFTGLLTVLLANLASAQQEYQAAKTLSTQTIVDGFVIRHTVFDSMFILPDVAKQYNIKRSKYGSLLNISVDPVGQTGGKIVEIEGSYKNLMQQQKVLKFQQISEKNAVYYLAPVRISGEETLHFDITITIDGKTLQLKFPHKVYSS